MAAAIAHSHVVIQFGSGDGRIEIRRIDQPPKPS
jgi:hypothetical protein